MRPVPVGARGRSRLRTAPKERTIMKAPAICRLSSEPTSASSTPATLSPAPGSAPPVADALGCRACTVRAPPNKPAGGCYGSSGCIAGPGPPRTAECPGQGRGGWPYLRLFFAYKSSPAAGQRNLKSDGTEGTFSESFALNRTDVWPKKIYPSIGRDVRRRRFACEVACPDDRFLQNLSI